ncbi:MAG: ATP-dependent DNA helicase [Sneathiellaceae bacterium]
MMPAPAEGGGDADAWPVLVAAHDNAAWLAPHAPAAEMLRAGEAARRAGSHPPILCHLPVTAARLKAQAFPALDLLELFAFVRPAKFCRPTPAGLAEATGQPAPADAADAALAMRRAAALLLAEMAGLPDRPRLAALAMTMARAGWPWGAPVLARLGGPPDRPGPAGGFDIWETLPEWVDQAPLPPPDSQPVSAAEAEDRLRDLLGAGAEPRPQQFAYAGRAAAAFAPRQQAGVPQLVLAEAGTGTGKTLGYVAPATVWVEKNGGTVWLSTYTKNLQRQVEAELVRRAEAAGRPPPRAVVRKGRENYLCLLNLQEAAQGGVPRPADAVVLGLMARWAQATRDGDMVGGDFPAWLVGLFGPARTLQLADRRGECVYSACPHYRRCYIEHVVRDARQADFVIANHALVMHQAVYGTQPADRPLRVVFDEGHHVFDAADGAFTVHLSAQETADLRRWLRGPEGGGRRSRARGLERRCGDLLAGDADSEAAMQEALQAAAALPAPGWTVRLPEGQPAGPAERFFAALRRQVMARSAEPDSPWGLESPVRPADEEVASAARGFQLAVEALLAPLRTLAKRIEERLEDEAEELDTSSRIRMDAAGRGLQRRADLVQAWRSMLADLHAPPGDGDGDGEAGGGGAGGGGAAPDSPYVDLFAVEREGGREMDIGYRRHWVDPTQPFAEAVLKRSHGVLITSASLCDSSHDAAAATDATDAAETDAGWHAAAMRTGALHMPQPALRFACPSPFDFAANSRILVVTDVRRDNVPQVTGAYRALFEAAGGGGLGLFTAIWRLRAVHRGLAPALSAAGLDLYAQHVDPLDNATLVEIFRSERNASLLGTDAMRDGVDVPGDSLRLIVFDRVPWPRPDLVHKARRGRFGGRQYDDMLTRLRLRQAFGRLLRSAGDRGIFVMLDPMLPSRLLDAFPTQAPVDRMGLAEAVATVRRVCAPAAAGLQREQ